MAKSYNKADYIHLQLLPSPMQEKMIDDVLASLHTFHRQYFDLLSTATVYGEDPIARASAIKKLKTRSLQYGIKLPSYSLQWVANLAERDVKYNQEWIGKFDTPNKGNLTRIYHNCARAFSDDKIYWPIDSSKKWGVYEIRRQGLIKLPNFETQEKFIRFEPSPEFEDYFSDVREVRYIVIRRFANTPEEEPILSASVVLKPEEDKNPIKMIWKAGATGIPGLPERR